MRFWAWKMKIPRGKCHFTPSHWRPKLFSGTLPVMLTLTLVVWSWADMFVRFMSSETIVSILFHLSRHGEGQLYFFYRVEVLHPSTQLILWHPSSARNVALILFESVYSLLCQMGLWVFVTYFLPMILALITCLHSDSFCAQQTVFLHCGVFRDGGVDEDPALSLRFCKMIQAHVVYFLHCIKFSYFFKEPIYWRSLETTNWELCVLLITKSLSLRPSLLRLQRRQWMDCGWASNCQYFWVSPAVSILSKRRALTNIFSSNQEY